MSNNDSQQIVNKAWNFAHVLRDDGLSYMAYTEQITFLLFLKMAYEQTKPPYNKPSIIPAKYNWESLLKREGDELEAHYRHILEELGKQPGMLGEIFKKARPEIQNPATLRRLIVDLSDVEKWSSMDADVKGDIYEGLLSKSAAESPKGAGQYFTPRELIKAIVDCVQPTVDDTVCDPAAGTGGFLLAAYDYVAKHQGKTLLKVNGRCAIVVPDNVLFEGGAGETVRRNLMKQCDVHTLLRLPTGIFYAGGVKANVLFLDAKPAQEKAWTKTLWVYDLRTNMHFTQKTNSLQRSDLDEFVGLYRPGKRHLRKSSWSEANPEGRWRSYEYDELMKRDKVNLDIFWLRDQSLEDSDDLPAPDILAQEIADDLQTALEQFTAIAEKLR